MRIKRRTEQRREHTRKLMVTVNTWAHARNLAAAALAGDLIAIQEFQQVVQYLPLEMRDSILAGIIDEN